MLLILDSTTKTLAARGSASATINYIVAYADSTATSFTEASAEGTFQSSTNVTILAAPSAGVKRVVKSINLYNNNGTPQGVIIAYQNSTGSLSYDIANILMGANERWSSSDRVIPPAQLIVGTTPVYNGNANEALSISSGGLLTQVSSTGTGIFVKATSPFVSGLTINTGGLTITNSPQSIVTDPGTFTLAAAATTVNVGSTANTSGINLAVGANGVVAIGGGAPSGGAPILRLTAPNGNQTGLKAASGSSVTYTLPSADGTSGQVLSTDGSGQLSWATGGGSGGSGLGFKNILINGGMAIDLRNEGSARTIADDVYGLDRWYVLTQNAAGCSVARETLIENGIPYNIILTQNQATAGRVGIAQIVEGRNCLHLRNQEVSFSFQYQNTNTPTRYAILEWTGTEDDVLSDIVNNWTSTSYTAGGFFNSANLIVRGVGQSTNTNSAWITPTTLTVTLGTTFKNLIVFVWTENTLSQSSAVRFSNLQLEPGATASAFDRRGFGIELALCQRYIYTFRQSASGLNEFIATGMPNSSGSYFIFLYPTVTPRISKGSNLVSANANRMTIVLNSNSYGTASIDSFINSGANTSAASIAMQVTSSVTIPSSGSGYVYCSGTTNPALAVYIQAEVEL